MQNSQVQASHQVGGMMKKITL